MGCWMSANGRLLVKPAFNDELIKEYIMFSVDECPEEYEEEKFENPWFFDSENMLICSGGKFAEPSIWYKFLKEQFFEPKGYELNGRPLFTGECDGNDFWELEMDKEYNEYVDWLRRVCNLFDDNSRYSKKFTLKRYEEHLGKNDGRISKYDELMNPMVASRVLNKIIYEIKERAEEAHCEYNRNKDDAFSDGRGIAYYEVLETIQNVLEANDIDLKKYDLNVNLEKKYI